jgi:uncharacterized protein (DUF2141 family)
MMKKSIRKRLLLASALAVVMPAHAFAARATLAVDPPVVRGGLQQGKNQVTSNVYNEQQLPTPLERRGGVGVTLVVTAPDGSEQTYRTKTKGTRFVGGQPRQKVKVAFDNVDVSSAGKYRLTVSVDKDDNPIEYSISQRSGAKSASFTVGGSSRGGSSDHEFVASVRWNGRPGNGLQAKLFTGEGTLVQTKRVSGSGKVSFKLSEGRYVLRLYRGAQELDQFDVDMPNKALIEEYTVSS